MGYCQQWHGGDYVLPVRGGKALAYTEGFRGFAGFDRPAALETDLGKKDMRVRGGAAGLLFVIAAIAGAQAHFNADAVRLNNRGVALMGQQFTEKAEQSFSDAFKKDPKLAQAAVNDGIALMTSAEAGRGEESAQGRNRAGSEERAGMVQPRTGATREQRAGRCAGELPTGGQDRSARCGFILLRGRLLSGDEAVRQSH